MVILHVLLTLTYGTKQQPNKMAHSIIHIFYVTYVMHENAMPILQSINGFMKLKPDYIGDPDIYLGAKLKKVEFG